MKTYYIKITNNNEKYWYREKKYLNAVFEIDNKLDSFAGGPSYKILSPHSNKGCGVDPHDCIFTTFDNYKVNKVLELDNEKLIESKELINRLSEIWKIK